MFLNVPRCHKAFLVWSTVGSSWSECYTVTWLWRFPFSLLSPSHYLRDKTNTFPVLRLNTNAHYIRCKSMHVPQTLYLPVSVNTLTDMYRDFWKRLWISGKVSLMCCVFSTALPTPSLSCIRKKQSQYVHLSDFLCYSSYRTNQI